MSQKINTTLCVINSIGLIALASLFYFQSPKIYYVDSAKLINQYKGMIEARNAYQAKASVWKANIDTLAKEVQDEISKYQQEGRKMSTRERELTEKLIESKKVQLVQYQQSIQEKAGQEDAEATQKVVTEINAFIKQYGEEHQCKIIFAATEYGNIAYAKEGLDLTETILEGLNSRFPAKAGK